MCPRRGVHAARGCPYPEGSHRQAVAAIELQQLAEYEVPTHPKGVKPTFGWGKTPVEMLHWGHGLNEANKAGAQEVYDLLGYLPTQLPLTSGAKWAKALKAQSAYVAELLLRRQDAANARMEKTFSNGWSLFQGTEAQRRAIAAEVNAEYGVNFCVAEGAYEGVPMAVRHEDGKPTGIVVFKGKRALDGGYKETNGLSAAYASSPEAFVGCCVVKRRNPNASTRMQQRVLRTLGHQIVAPSCKSMQKYAVLLQEAIQLDRYMIANWAKAIRTSSAKAEAGMFMPLFDECPLRPMKMRRGDDGGYIVPPRPLALRVRPTTQRQPQAL